MPTITLINLPNAPCFMKKKGMQKEAAYIIAGFAAVALLMAGSAIFLYKTITDDYTAKLMAVDAKLEIAETALMQQIKEESARNLEQRKLLEKQMISNFRQLEDSITNKTSTLKLDLESQLTAVSQQVEETSSELEGKIAALDVQSSDFSAIVDDVIKGVVSVKTNSGKQGSGVIFDSQGYILTNK